MATFSYEDYEKQEQTKNNKSSNGPIVRYFSLKDDGEEAIVRFIYDSPKDFVFESVHNVSIDGQFRRISCLRTSPFEKLDHCPLCAKGDPVYTKFYIKLIQYERDENDNLVAVPKVWERPANFSNILKSMYEEYGVLSDSVYKIKRRGKKGDLHTTYDIIPANPAIYKPEIYVKDFAAFDTYNLHDYVVLDKSYDELAVLANGGAEAAAPSVAPAQSTSGTYQSTSGTYQEPVQRVVSSEEASKVEEPSNRPRRYTY